MDSPLMAATPRGARGAAENSPRPAAKSKTQGRPRGESPSSKSGSKGDAKPGLSAMLQNRDVHARLYVGGSDQKIRVKDARQKKEEPPPDPKPGRGTASEACQRIHDEGVKRKKEVLVRARSKYEDEFQENHPFRPELAKPRAEDRQEAWQRLQDRDRPKSPFLVKSRSQYEEELQERHPFSPKLNSTGNVNREEWLREQKEWQKKKLERRHEMLREKRQEEAQELQALSVHRKAPKEAGDEAGRRLFAAAQKRDQRQTKRRMERLAEAQDEVNLLHRKLENSPAAPTAVAKVVDRLYCQDPAERDERHRQRLKQKRLAEKAEDHLQQALSVHTPLPQDDFGLDSDEVSLKMEQDLEILELQLRKLRKQTLHADYGKISRHVMGTVRDRAESPATPRSRSEAKTPRKGKPAVSPRREGNARNPYAGGAAAPAKPRSRTPPAPGPAPATPRAASRGQTPRRAPAAGPDKSPRAATPRVAKAPGARPVPSKSPVRKEEPKEAVQGSRAKDGAKTFGRAKDVDAAKRDTKTSQKKRAEGQDRKANVQAAQGKKARSSSESERERARNVESREGLDNRKEAKEEGRKATRTDSGDDGQQKRSTTTRRKDSEQAEGPSAKNEVDREQELAATKIQSRMRGKQARREVEQRKQGAKAGKKDSDDEGQKKQSTKSRRKDSEEAAGPGDKNEVDREQELAATKIQSRMRGKQARREVEQRKQGAKAGRKDSDDEGQKKHSTKTQELAATKIQSRMRGKQARREVEKKKAARKPTPASESEESGGEAERESESESGG
ncbi:unnamed protein product [Effrenium voratum]|nr:unnamed protein product [Effrenium voratum]